MHVPFPPEKQCILVFRVKLPQEEKMQQSRCFHSRDILAALFMFPDLTTAVQIATLTMFAIKVWELHRDGHIFKKDGTRLVVSDSWEEPDLSHDLSKKNLLSSSLFT